MLDATLPEGIIGYTYRADNYCPACALAKVLGDRGIEGHGLSYVIDDALALIARFEGVDRDDEWTFDSDDFPKIVYAGMENVGDCGACGSRIS